MNRWEGYGRVVSKGELKKVGTNNIEMLRFTLACNRKTIKTSDGQPTADFISCVAWGKLATTVNNYVNKGNRLSVCGRIQTGSYENKDGQKVYTTDITVEDIDFVETKAEKEATQSGEDVPEQKPKEKASAAKAPESKPKDDDFMAIPDDIDASELPFA